MALTLKKSIPMPKQIIPLSARKVEIAKPTDKAQSLFDRGALFWYQAPVKNRGFCVYFGIINLNKGEGIVVFIYRVGASGRM